MNNGDFELVYSPREVYERLKIADSTLRKWCLALEAENYTFKKEDNKENGTRIFFENDISALRLLQSYLDSGQNMKNATNLTMARLEASSSRTGTGTVLVQKEPDSPFFERSLTEIMIKMEERFEERVKNAVQQELSSVFHELSELKSLNTELINQNHEMKSLLPSPQNLEEENRLRLEQQRIEQQRYEELKNLIPAPRDQQKERLERANEMLTRRRIEQGLEREALTEWNRKPEGERMKKLGLFRKEVDIEKRNQFVKEYINLHFEERILQEFS